MLTRRKIIQEIRISKENEIIARRCDIKLQIVIK